MRAAALCLLFLLGCNDRPDPYWQEINGLTDRAWNGRCIDESTLVATTSGSPNSFRCWNRNHRMRVEVKTQSGEEIAALVICECARAETAKP